MASSLSSDEGEIVENGAADSKGTTLPRREANGVDRGANRNRGRGSRSPSDHGRPSYRSGSPRGSKRTRDDRDYNSSRGGSDRDPRRFRVHYEDGPRNDNGGGRHSRHGYEDLDRPGSGHGSSYDHRDYRYDDRDHDRDSDRYSDKRARNRSRSPYRAPPRGGDRARRDNDRGRREGGRRGNRFSDGEQADYTKYSSAHNDRRPREDYTSKRAHPVADASHLPKVDAKSVKGVAGDRSRSRLVDAAQERGPKSEPEPAPQQDDWEEPTPVDEEAEIERRRRRREELLRKSRGSTPMQAQLQLLSVQSDKVATPTSAQSNTPIRTEANTPRSGPGTPPMSPAPGQEPGTPDVMDLFNDQDLINKHGEGKELDEDGPSAADYDPTADMKEDGLRDELRHGNVGLHGEVPDTRPAAIPSTQTEPVEQTDDADASKSGGGDEDEDFDMFAEDFEDKYVPPSKSTKADKQEEQGDGLAAANEGGILDGDDKDGYYKIRPGEVLNGRYQIQSMLGKGMFSGVARAVDVTSKSLVAIKIMRNNDALRKGGYTEIAILQKLNSSDPDGKKHIVRFERAFEHKGHLCMAFENLSLNLREVLKKFGNNVGINLRGVRAYAYQIFVALGHMRKCSIIHADLKPDNILVNEQRNVLKLCDLGTAIDRSDAATAHNEITPYLVSRFYRAPEIILGMPYDYAVDTWSIGCTLYEMYTGKILFVGDSNNQMLRAIMEIRGKMSRKLYQRGELWPMHFDELGNFISLERDKILGKTNVRTLAAIKPTRDLRTRLMAASTGMSDAEARELNHFYDLLDRCLNVNPDKRITPSDALKHPFFTSKGHAGVGASSTASSRR